jgi:hypothetical protein
MRPPPAILFFAIVIILTFIYSHWFNPVSLFTTSLLYSSCLIISIRNFLLIFLSILQFKLSADNSRNLTIIVPEKHPTPTKKAKFPALNCSTETNFPTTFNPDDVDPSSTHVCPGYFRWIQEDLRPWKATGISREMVEKAKRTAHFRLVIVNGKAYVEKYRKSIQTRDVFTIWGILQLLRKYPGRIPDLELMFDCDDQPVIRSGGRNTTGPPPLFRYCGDRWTRDVVFPDWSFWGW